MSDSEDTITDVPSISQECIEHISTMKRCVYDAIVNGPSLDTKEAQSNERVVEYRQVVQRIYELIKKIKRTKQVPPLNAIPQTCQPAIQQGLEYIKSVYAKNTFSENIAYDHLFETQFRTHPFEFIISSEDIEW